MKNLCIDLCCGLKGFSKAFVEAGWEVVTVDIEPKFEPTILLDVRILNKDDVEKYTKQPLAKYETIIILASPPCERFSLAPHAWPLPGIREALEIVGAVLELITTIKPKYWALENPTNGHLKWFIGKPAKRLRLNAFGYKTVKPTGLWGNIPLGLIPDSPKKNDRPKAFANLYSKRPDKRAEIPRGLSHAILEAIVVEKKQEGSG